MDHTLQSTSNDSAPPYTAAVPSDKSSPAQPQSYLPQQQEQHQQQPQAYDTPFPSQPQFNGNWPSSQEPKYQASVSLANLQGQPAPVDCPACHTRALTKTLHETGNTTHAWGAGLCIFICCGCIPYMMDSTKDVVHSCGKCGVALARWHRSGHTTVTAYA